VPLALRTAVFANCDVADAWLAKNDPEENLPQRRLGVGGSIKKTEQLLMEPEVLTPELLLRDRRRRYETAHVADSQRSWNRCSRTSARAR
jgi:hypothetical protein